jgi:hypothetical protein
MSCTIFDGTRFSEDLIMLTSVEGTIRSLSCICRHRLDRLTGVRISWTPLRNNVYITPLATHMGNASA